MIIQKKNDAKSDPRSDQVVDTHTSDGNERKVTATDTTKGNSPHKLLTNQEIPAIIPAIIPLVNQTTADTFAISGSSLHAVHAVLYKEIITSATCSAAGVLKHPPVVNWKGASGTIPRDRNTVGITHRETNPVQTGTGPSIPPIIIEVQKIDGPRQPIIPQEVRNAEPIDASINRIPSEHRNPTLSWSKLIGRKFVNESSAGVYARYRMNLASNTVLRESPKFMDFGLSSVDTTDELGYVFSSTTIIGSVGHVSEWLLCSHCIIEATADRVIGTKEKNHYNLKSEFETWRDKVVDQYFGRQNDSIS